MKGTRDPIKKYRFLIQSFLDKRLTALEFERQFLRLFKDEPDPLASEAYEILNKLFSDVDAFCANPSLRSSKDLDELALVQSAENALRALDAMKTGDC